MNLQSIVKNKIAENKPVLINITEVNDLFLTELVGEAVLEESTKESILDGRMRTEINRRFFDWLCKSDDQSVFEIFLFKLRETGQRHVANLLDGTPGELPLNQKVRQTLQKMMRDLTCNIDLDSGLLESLLAVDVINEIDYQEIKAGQTKLVRAKSLWDALLRGSDHTFEKFKGEIVKTQPEMIAIIEQQDGIVRKPHVDLLKKHCDVLSRCMDVNLLTIAYLESKGVIDKGLSDALKSTDELVKRRNQVYNFLLFKPKDLFDSFLQVMQENEQKHVANLLMENFSGQQPLLEERYKRLVEIKPGLMIGIHRSEHLIAAISGIRENEESDFAISHNDYEVLTQKCITHTEKNSALVDAVLRRTDHSLKSLEDALRSTGQENMADYLNEGIFVAIDAKTTRTDKEERLTPSFNDCVSFTSSEEQSSEEHQQLEESFELLSSLNVPVIAAQNSNSIMIYTYLKRPEDAKTYVRLFKNGFLQRIYEKILNLLLKIAEPDNFQPLEAAIVLGDEDKKLVEEFTGLDVENCSLEEDSYCPLHGKLMHTYCHDCSEMIRSPSVEQEKRPCSLSDTSGDIATKREQLQQDLQLVSNCRSTSGKLMEEIDSKQSRLVRLVEQTEAAIKKKCEDLKTKVENFKQMLLKDQERFKELALGQMAEQKRVLESYVFVASDFEEQVKQLIQKGTTYEICESFDGLHRRATKLKQKSPEQPMSDDLGVFRDRLKLLPSVPEETRHVEISEELVLNQINFLHEYLDPESGLLEELVSYNALSEEAASEIKKQSSYREKNKTIIDIIVKDNKCKELGIALVKSKQSHLVNYLETQGNYDPKFGHSWPVMESERDQLDTMKDEMPCLFVPFEFMSSLCVLNIINLRHRDLILSRPSLEARCDALLEILKRGSKSEFSGIMELLSTLQARPQLKLIAEHREFLGDCLNADSSLLDVLKPHLSSKEMKSIKGERSQQKRNLKLVDIISSSKKDEEFIEALNKTGQKHIANYLKADGEYNSEFAGEWPAVCSDEWEMIEANREWLMENLNLLNIMDDLLLRNVISSKQSESLLLTKSKRDRNEAFLNMLGHGTIENCTKAIKYFHASKIIEIPVEPVIGELQVQLRKEVAEMFFGFVDVFAFGLIQASM